MSDDNSTNQSQFSEEERPVEVKKVIVKRSKPVASKVILDPVGNVFFDELIKKYPKSPEAAKAQKILQKKAKVPVDLFPDFADILNAD